MVREYSICLSVKFAPWLSANNLERINMLLSGVRSSWDILARNSDL